MLDAVSVYEPGAGQLNVKATNLAVGGITEAGAVVMVDGVLDVSNLVSPAISLIYVALELGVRAGLDRDQMILELREFIDQD